MDFSNPTELRREVEGAFLLQKGARDIRRTILKSYKGQSFNPDGMRTPENRIHEYVSIMTGKIAGGDPKAMVSHGGGYEERKQAAFMTAGLQQWIIQTRHRRLLQRMAPHFLTSWGFTLTTLEKMAGFTDTEDDVTLPNVVPLDPDDVAVDPLATSWETKRWCCHKYARVKKELITYAKAHPDEGWDLKVLENLPEDAGASDEISGRDQLRGEVPRRGEVFLYDVWALNGDGTSSLYTLAMRPEGDGEFVRERRDYYGPPTGPYTLWGVYTVPGQVLPMSPVMAIWGQLEELNRNCEATSIASRRGKSIAISALPDKHTKDINDARDGDTIHVPGYQKEHFDVYQFGYVTRERIQMMDMLSSRVDRVLGMDDTARGNVTGQGTATEVALANNASTARVDYVAQRFAECDEECLMTVLWYLYHENTVEFDIAMSDDDREAMGVDKVTYQGGAAEGDKFDGYVLDIDRYSLQRTNEMQQRSKGQDLLTVATGLVPLIPQIAPFCDVEELFNRIGQMWNLPELGELVSGDKGAEVMNAQMSMQQQSAGQASGQAVPPSSQDGFAPQPSQMGMNEQ